MICYKDMTFCQFYENCKNGEKCFRALKDEVKKDAEKLGLLISRFTDLPGCYKEKSIKYRKRPIIVEAFQMTKERRGNNVDWPEWLHKAWNLDKEDEGAVYPSKSLNSDGTDELMINTLEGCHLINFGDWIIKGVEGELYPCKPDIFIKTYEKVE